MPDKAIAEERRLAALHALELLDTASCENFDRICRMAAEYFKVPTALISLVDRDRQWFKSRVGFDEPQTPISQSFCAFTVQGREVLEVRNAALDPRFQDNPLVTRDQGIRFYAGAPLLTASGYAIGSLCIIDKVEQQLSIVERQQLRDMAAMVMEQVEQRQRQRRRDPVSGLANREQFQSDLRDLVEHHIGEQRVLVLIDALDMKVAHELTLALGLAPFETIIRFLALRLQEYLGRHVRVYHVSVKRFGFLLPAPAEELDRLLDALVSRLRRQPPGLGFPMIPTVCAGTVEFEIDTQSVDDALRKAMFALELAMAGRSFWAHYDAARDHAQRRAFNLASDLNDALRSGQIYLMFQPRFALPDGAQVSAEALLRWEHPWLGPISPAEFIPVMERNGLIHQVTRWVIDTVLSKLRTWGLPESSKLSINLSPKDFEDQDIAELIRRACELHGIDPRRLEVEITEGEWLRSNPNVLAQLTRIRELGMDVAIDDFGTGYSNFAYLHQIPANVVKLDKSMITDLERNTQHQKITRSIISLARELGYRTVAEGIESFKCLQMLYTFGCDEAQGYFLARPMLQERFLAWSGANRFPLQLCV
ncbi:diguanylate phosphodiesterase [Pseudomonas sp. GW456-L14]|uniref:sensor domain-containing phosphodiesterase n=1 Tax=unclassified Pseudomonas TaxID=196821 RepID=UPI000C883C94|nr:MULTISPECIES: sensor domain-containing phosphodiesterase [unclassified Pseudomonas]PMY31650.1 diguanylate phosphodiesterase [Pseudomonas sp. GW456-L14]PMY48902.1 diguanylate phosphodiesterase [Pseudomonas sp. GW456-L12]